MSLPRKAKHKSKHTSVSPSPKLKRWINDSGFGSLNRVMCASAFWFINQPPKVQQKVIAEYLSLIAVEQAGQ